MKSGKNGRGFAQAVPLPPVLAARLLPFGTLHIAAVAPRFFAAIIHRHVMLSNR